MRVIQKPRAAGKSHDLVEMAIAKGFTIVVGSQERREHLLAAYYPKLKPDQVVLFGRAREHLRGRPHDIKLAIDDLDYILNGMLGREVACITITGREEE